MAGNHPHDSEGWRDLENDPLDCELNAALGRFTTAEPRAGLEQRVLARLRAEEELRSKGFRWRWPVAVALASFAVALAVSGILRSVRPTPGVAVRRSPSTAAKPAKPEIQATNDDAITRIALGRTRNRRRNNLRIVSHTAPVADRAPKLDRFPSPRPLSEQERILQAYFPNYSKDAVLVARAWAEARRRDAEEEMGDDLGMSEEDLQP